MWQWRKQGERDKPRSDLHRELSDLMDALDSYWIRVAEDEVFAYGFRPFEEIRVQYQAIDEESGAPLNIAYTVRPPNPIYGLRWLASKKPKVWGRQAVDPVDKAPTTPQINIAVINDGKSMPEIRRT